MTDIAIALTDLFSSEGTTSRGIMNIVGVQPLLAVG
jgi:hypothetical protein